MSRTIPAGLVSHIAGETTTLATCIKITRADGAVYAFTSHDNDLLIDGVLHEAAFSLGASALQTADDYSMDNAEADGALDSVRITEADIRAGRWDGAAVSMYLVNWQDTSAGKIAQADGELGEIQRTRYGFRTELLGLVAKLQRTIGRLVTPTCPWVLGVSNCTKSLASFTTAGVAVTSVTSNRIFAASSLGAAAGYYNAGKLTWTTGLNTGLVMEIDLHQTAGALTLKLPMPYTVAVADQFTIVAGCGKTLAICLATFNNVVNFGGFPHIQQDASFR